MRFQKYLWFFINNFILQEFLALLQLLLLIHTHTHTYISILELLKYYSSAYIEIYLLLFHYNWCRQELWATECTETSIVRLLSSAGRQNWRLVLKTDTSEYVLLIICFMFTFLTPPTLPRELVQSNKRKTTQTYSLWYFGTTTVYCITEAWSHDKTSTFMLDVLSNRRVYWHFSLGKVEFSMSLCS